LPPLRCGKTGRCFNRDAESVEGSGEMGRGYPPPHPNSLGERHKLPQWGKILIFRLFPVSKTRRLCCYFAKFITLSQLEKLAFSFYLRSSIASYSSGLKRWYSQSTDVRPFVCPSVRPFVTLRYCIKTSQFLLYWRTRRCSFLLQCIVLGVYPPPSVQLYVATSPISWSSGTAQR